MGSGVGSGVGSEVGSGVGLGVGSCVGVNVGTGVPAISVFVMKEGIRKYRIWLYEISSGGGSRSEVIEGMADCYAGDLEGVLHKYPSQWFNFYEFWG